MLRSWGRFFPVLILKKSTILSLTQIKAFLKAAVPFWNPWKQYNCFSAYFKFNNIDKKVFSLYPPFKRNNKKKKFIHILSLLNFTFFLYFQFWLSVRGTAAPSVVCWWTSQGQRERLQRGWVCPLQHHCTNRQWKREEMGVEGKRLADRGVGVGVGRWGDRVFILGSALKSFRERVVKMGMCCPSLVSQFV